jgi:hypothetical protein
VFNATAGRDTALPMPYYPGYQRGATCAWQVSFDRPVSMPPSQTAWFAGVNFTMLDISCASSDRVRVYVGTVAAPDALLWSSCSSTDPTPLLWLGVDAAQPTATMLVQFSSGVSDASGVGAGFRALAVVSSVAQPLAVGVVSVPSFCPGPAAVHVPAAASASVLVLSSFGPPVVTGTWSATAARPFPYPYPNTSTALEHRGNVDCTWRVTASEPAAQVLVTFTTLDTQTQRPSVCEFDFVAVDGMRLCGTYATAPLPRVISTQGFMGKPKAVVLSVSMLFLVLSLVVWLISMSRVCDRQTFASTRTWRSPTLASWRLRCRCRSVRHPRH